MSNLLLRQLRERGLIAGEVLPFASPGPAREHAARAGKAVMILDAVNTGDYWVVDKDDAARLQSAGYKRDEHAD